MRHDHTGNPNVAAKMLLAGIVAIAIAIGMLVPLPGHSHSQATQSQIPTLEVGKH
jgi:hypothetical protein